MAKRQPVGTGRRSLSRPSALFESGGAWLGTGRLWAGAGDRRRGDGSHSTAGPETKKSGPTGPLFPIVVPRGMDQQL